VVGEIVQLRHQLNWFERRPLFGRRIVVTRAQQQAGDLSRSLRERGAEVLEIPTIKIVPTRRTEVIDEVMSGLNGYDWIVFTSANGVTSFFERFLQRFQDLRDLGGVRLAAVGPGTAAKLKELHLQVDAMPAENVGKKIAAAIREHQSLENLRLLLPRAEAANPELPALLEAMGAIVDDIGFYETVPETNDPSGVAARFLEHGSDWITFTSGSTVTHFHARFDLVEIRKRFPALRMATIGPETSKALKQLGLDSNVEANPHTIEGLVTALEQAERRP
jgi:uroporphyrinogen III methyltransferase / synthase